MVHLRACRTPDVWSPWFSDVTPGEERGFVPDVVQAANALTGFTVEWVPFDQTPFLTGRMSYTALLFDLVAKGLCDLAILWVDNPADFDARLDADTQVVHTQPFVRTTISILVRKERIGIGGWQMFEPFETELWLAIAGTWLVIAASMATLEATRSFTYVRGVTRGLRALVRLVIRSLYYSAAALLGGDTYEWVGWPSKLVHVCVLFFTLVVLASYTASLTAFMTRPTWAFVGPLTRAELSQQTTCLINIAHEPMLIGLMGGQGDTIHPPADIMRQGPLPSMQWCSEQVLSGGAASMLVADSEVSAFLADGGCDNFGFPPALRKIGSAAMSFSVGGHSGHDALAVATNLSRAIFTLTTRPEYYQLLEDYGIDGYVCSDERKAADSALEPRLQVQHISGLFIVVYAALGVAVLGGLAEKIFLRSSHDAESDERDKEDGQKSSTRAAGMAGMRSPASAPGLEGARGQYAQRSLLRSTEMEVDGPRLRVPAEESVSVSEV